MITDEKKAKEIKYAEPVDYFPESIRKEYGLGEYLVEDKESEKNE